MKKTFFFSIILTALFACNKTEVETPEFNVTTDKAAYKVGEKVTFSFSGNPDFIAFYSGEAGKQYEYRNRSTVDGVPQLQFTSFMQYGPQPNSLFLLASTDFNGVYNPDNIAAATWTDITSRATLSTGADNTASGVIDLSDLHAGGKPLYLAFKYVAAKLPVSQPTWTIKNVAIDSKLADGTLVPVKKMADITWAAVNVLNPAKSWTFNTTQLQMAGGAAQTDDNEDWIITQPLILNAVLSDRAVSLKPFDTQVKSYQYTYTQPGTYKAAFEVSNTTVYDSKTNVKEIEIKIED